MSVVRCSLHRLNILIVAVTALTLIGFAFLSQPDQNGMGDAGDGPEHQRRSSLSIVGISVPAIFSQTWVIQLEEVSRRVELCGHADHRDDAGHGRDRQQGLCHCAILGSFSSHLALSSADFCSG